MYHTEISLDKIHIKFIKTLSIKNLYIQDLQGDTLLYCANFDIDLASYDLDKHFFNFRNISLDKATINLVKYKEDKGYNFNQ